MLFRALCMIYLWAVTLHRASSPIGHRGSNALTCPDYEDCARVEVLLVLLALGGGLISLRSLCGFVNFWLIPRLRHLLGIAHWPSRIERQWACAYGGHLGVYQLTTLIFASTLAAAGAICDMTLGWEKAVLYYATGGFFGGIHLLYFLVGFHRTGPLMVLLAGPILKDCLRWMTLYIPILGAFAYGLVMVDSGAANQPAFQDYFTGVLRAIDVTIQTVSTVDAMSGGNRGANSAGKCGL